MPPTMTPPASASTQTPPITTTVPATTGPPTTTTTTTTTQVPLPPGSLVCTIGQGFDKSTYTFPPDGLCTIIIFDSLYRKNASLAPPYPDDFGYFLETARKAHSTEFGIGIHQSITTNATAAMQLASDPSTKKYLYELWEHYEIYHYAQVTENQHFPGYYSVYVAGAVRGLEMISALTKDKRNPFFRPSYTILFSWIPTPITVGSVAWRLANEVTLDVFIAMGYFRLPNINFKECLMVAPTYLPTALRPDSLKNAYMYNLGYVFTCLPAHSDEWPSKTQRAVAVGMGGRWYLPCAKGPLVNNRPANYSLGYRCGRLCGKQTISPENQIRSIVNACLQPAYNSSFYLDTNFEALVAFDVAQELIFTYDTASNLRSK
ncbi:hypothetical protein MTO96_013744, partial [Rhipicephalus appendiculatus]